ncbi:MAG: hypothetical protein JRI23_27775 [Deltaproteobacteria bacterium]|jgi:hypothetical protein|nr:hypothetical protein [Deltaproteobacteria bacterium]MBW2535888.1 hypothetical protein [Deltaproteobacteria bacterium]
MKHLVRPWAALVVLAAVGFGIASADTSGTEPPDPEPGTAALDSAPAVAIVATEPTTGRSELYVVGPTGDDGAASESLRPLASWSHLAEGNVRAETLPASDSVVANAPVTPGRDTSFNGGLFTLRPGVEPVELCRDLVHGSRPLVTAAGRVYVARGRAGPWPSEPGSYRVDTLWIDEVDPHSGSLRRVHQAQGYVTHLAAWHEAELILYRVAPHGADLVAVHAETGSVRPVRSPVQPFARDFSVDHQRGVLVFRSRHESDSRRWTIEELDLRTGAMRRVYEGPTFALAPHVWPGGGLAFSPRRSGWTLLGSGDPVARPLGRGVDVLRSVSPDRRYVAALHTVQGTLGVPFVVDRRSGRAARLAAPAGRRVAVAGFVTAPEGSP